MAAITKVFTLLIISGMFNTSFAGIIYYRKPSKVMYYETQPPVYVYPKHVKFVYPPKQKIHYSDLYLKDPLKYSKHKYINKIKHTFHVIDHTHLDKNVQHEWSADNGHIKFSEPVFRPDYYSNHGHTGSDIKPVEEHIEDDIKYDFRTKTHSYSN